MSVEGLEALIKKAESIDKGDAEQIKQDDPEYISGDDLKKQCLERAKWLVGKYHIVATLVKPEAATLVLTDKALNEGVDRLAKVLEKYPTRGELPPWLIKILSYEELFVCGVWFGGSMLTIYKVDEQIKAEREKQKNQKSEKTDLATTDNNNDGQ